MATVILAISLNMQANIDSAVSLHNLAGRNNKQNSFVEKMMNFCCPTFPGTGAGRPLEQPLIANKI